MYGTGSETRDDARLTELAAARPEWRAWLELLRLSGAALDRDWIVADVRAATQASPRDGAPTLDGATLQIDAGEVSRLLSTLIPALGADRKPRALSDAEAAAVLEAALRVDEERMRSAASEFEIGADEFAVVAEFLVRPVLGSCARLLEESSPDHWPYGYCPLCGARPLLAELLGLDRKRFLRCGRCGTGWEAILLRCAHCGESDHRKLGSLVSEEEGVTVKVETCDTCHGFLKSLTTLQARPLWDLLVNDLETVEFDLIALERGYFRPPAQGFKLNVRVRPPGIAQPT